MVIICFPAVAIFICGCGSDKTVEQNPPTDTPSVKVAEVKNFYANGQFKVGADVPAGEYIAVGTGYVCVSTTPEANAINGEILINDNVQNSRLCVTANADEYIQIMGDIKLYSASDAPAIDTSGEIPAGQYKVGRDIKAGEYKINLLTDGYFAVTRDGRRDFVKNQFAQSGGSFYAAVTDSQYLQIKNGTGVFVEASKEVKPAPKPTLPPKSEPPPKVLNLGMTFEQFKSAYDAKIAEYAPETGWNVSATTLANGKEQDVFLWQFMERVALMGMVSKDNGLLKNLVVMSLPQNQTDYEAAVLAYGLAIATLNPELNYGQRSELLGELHVFDALYDTFMDLKQRNYDALRGNVKYQTGYIASKGALHFWASAKDL